MLTMKNQESIFLQEGRAGLKIGKKLQGHLGASNILLFNLSGGDRCPLYSNSFSCTSMI